MKSILCFCILLLTASLAQANVKMSMPEPTPVKPGKVVLRSTLEIRPDSSAFDARLQISESNLKQLRAALDGTTGNTPIAASVVQSQTRTIVAGLLMFLAVSIAGVFFARSVRSSSFGRTQKVVVALILVVAVVGVAAIITRGNAGPPNGYRWRNLPQALAQGRVTAGSVEIEIVPDDELSSTQFRLIIPQPKKAPGEE
jgi:hypothetical protein